MSPFLTVSEAFVLIVHCSPARKKAPHVCGLVLLANIYSRTLIYENWFITMLDYFGH